MTDEPGHWRQPVGIESSPIADHRSTRSYLFWLRRHLECPMYGCNVCDYASCNHYGLSSILGIYLSVYIYIYGRYGFIVIANKAGLRTFHGCLRISEFPPLIYGAPRLIDLTYQLTTTGPPTMHHWVVSGDCTWTTGISARPSACTATKLGVLK